MYYCMDTTSCCYDIWFSGDYTVKWRIFLNFFSYYYNEERMRNIFCLQRCSFGNDLQTSALPGEERKSPFWFLEEGPAWCKESKGHQDLKTRADVCSDLTHSLWKSIKPFKSMDFIISILSDHSTFVIFCLSWYLKALNVCLLESRIAQELICSISTVTAFEFSIMLQV